MDELQQQRDYLDRLIHRRGDVETMLDDCRDRERTLREEAAELKGAIAMTRKRIGALEQAAQQAGPRVIPMPTPAGAAIVDTKSGA